MKGFLTFFQTIIFQILFTSNKIPTIKNNSPPKNSSQQPPPKNNQKCFKIQPIRTYFSKNSILIPGPRK